MNLDRIRQHLDAERRYLARDGEAVHVLPCLTRVVRDSRRMVSWSSLDEVNADAVIAHELQQHRTADVAFEWKLYALDTPADLLARLQRQGLVAGVREAVLVYDLAAGPPPGASDQCTIIRITRPEQIEDYRRVAEEALGKDYGFTSGELADGLAQGSTQHLGYIAYEGTEPVGIGRLYTHPLSVFGGLYGGTVREQYRGRGIYRALVVARARAAMELGARHLIVDALPTSRPILERLGFGHLDDTIPCEMPR